MPEQWPDTVDPQTEPPDYPRILDPPSSEWIIRSQIGDPRLLTSRLRPQTRLLGHQRIQRATQNRRTRKPKLGLQMVVNLPQNARLRLLQAFFALRFWFGSQPNISLAVDASGIGCKSCLPGLISRPDRHGAWLPLQEMRCN